MTKNIQNAEITQVSNVIYGRFADRLKVGGAVDKDHALKVIELSIARIEHLLAELETGEGRIAFKRFMSYLQDPLTKVKGMVRIKNNASWVKIESILNGHRIYISKGKVAVGRVDSTLPPELIEGAKAPGRRNGRIASWIPAEPAAVAAAIQLLGSSTIKPLK